MCAHVSRSLVTAKGNFRLPFRRWWFLPHVNKSTAWIHNCVSSVLLCTQKRVCTNEDIDDTLRARVCVCKRESQLKPSLGSLIMETILLQCEKGEKGWLVTAHATLRCRLPCAWLREYLNTCANVRTRMHRPQRTVTVRIKLIGCIKKLNSVIFENFLDRLLIARNDSFIVKIKIIQRSLSCAVTFYRIIFG